MMCIVRRSLTFIKILKAGHSIDSGKSFSISVENCLEFSSFQFLLGSINSLYKAQSSIILFSGIHRQPTESRVILYHPQKLLKLKTHSSVSLFHSTFYFLIILILHPAKRIKLVLLTTVGDPLSYLLLSINR